MIEVRTATRENALRVAGNLRDEDRAEVIAATGEDPVAAVLSSFEQSRRCYTLHHQGEPIGVFGVADGEEGLGIVWMLCTPGVRPVAREVLRRAPRWVARLASGYRGLTNAAWAENYLHVRWCKASGFVELGRCEINGHSFYLIYRPTICVT